MPCTSHISDSTLAIARVMIILDELQNNITPNPRHFAEGFHQHAPLDAKKEDADLCTAILCSILKERDVSKLSLETQIWWRDHQAHDTSAPN